MTDPHPKRLTAKRASALIAAVERGVGEWRLQVADAIESKQWLTDDGLRNAQRLDGMIRDALVAREIIFDRIIEDAEEQDTATPLAGLE